MSNFFNFATNNMFSTIVMKTLQIKKQWCTSIYVKIISFLKKVEHEYQENHLIIYITNTENF